MTFSMFAIYSNVIFKNSSLLPCVGFLCHILYSYKWLDIVPVFHFIFLIYIFISASVTHKSNLPQSLFSRVFFGHHLCLFSKYILVLKVVLIFTVKLELKARVLNGVII